MRMRTLGGTGIKVSPYCLGAMMFGAWGNRDHDDAIRIIHRALDAGINFIDTADVYSAGESEEITGKALAGRRDDVILATKCHFYVDTGGAPSANVGRPVPPNASGSSRRYRRDTGVDMSKGRPARLPVRFDQSLPGNQRKLDLVEDLLPLAEKAGVPLTHMAIAFTLEHPGVTSAIIGPRTMEQLETLLGA